MPGYPRIKVVAAARGRTIASLAEPAGVSVATLRAVIGGRAAVWPRLRSSLADVLEVDVDWLWSPTPVDIASLQEVGS